MAWLSLFIAGLLEVVWVISLKYSYGFTRLTPSIVTIITMACSFFLLAYAMKSLPMELSYAVWTSIGIIGSTLVGFCIFNESVNMLKVVCLFMILMGVIGLKLTSS